MGNKKYRLLSVNDPPILVIFCFAFFLCAFFVSPSLVISLAYSVFLCAGCGFFYGRSNAINAFVFGVFFY